MHLIQILLPLYDNEGRPFAAPAFDRVRNELGEKFGGVTAFRGAPAEGLWKEGGRSVSLLQSCPQVAKEILLQGGLGRTSPHLFMSGRAADKLSPKRSGQGRQNEEHGKGILLRLTTATSLLILALARNQGASC